VPKKKRPPRTTKLEEYRLRGNRKGAVVKEQTWLENGKIVAYSLVYINPNRCFVDNGRVLGYDNRHGYHHRHCMGKIEPIVFSNYESLARRFYKELRELWRKEDEEG
jgi:Family of unknown function (DUF6516)